jgi:ADP-ribose pyrophosphatase YjhB (NUDIX family)
MKTIEIVVRGVVARGGRVLLNRRKGTCNAFLPGGHIRFGEPARAALVREIREEIGTDVEVKDFLGVVEHSWEDENGLNHEVNLIFKIECEELDPSKSPRSNEPHLEFFWQPVNDLGAVRLEPSAIIVLLPRWLSGKPDSEWGSTIE